jgi:(p)ppGpp synthase/HD superfamily hydrolase
MKTDKEFWNGVDKAAEKVDKWPQWKKDASAVATTSLDIVKKATLFAIKAHKDTPYGKSNLPYKYHLEEVVRLLGDVPAYIIAAAWLHDIVEDTGTTLDDLRNLFGGRVTRIVDCVTDGPGDDRRTKKALMYKKLANGPVEARRVKLADRAANMRASMENPKMSIKYAEEFPEFIEIAGVDPENDDLTLVCYRLYMTSMRSLGKI